MMDAHISWLGWWCANTNTYPDRIVVCTVAHYTAMHILALEETGGTDL